MKKTIIYTRASSANADRNFSLKKQAEYLRKKCEVEQIEIVKHVQENSTKTF